IVAQYYNFLRLGRAGYAQVMTALQDVAVHLRAAVARTGHFALVGSGRGLPLVCFRLVGERTYDEHDVSEKLRERGWIVPAYPLAPDADHVTVLRVVVREGFSRDMADLLADDLVTAVWRLDRLPPRAGGAGGGPAPPRPAPKTARVC
ncbi:MAG TPA: pyridoxal-dependent decarboxylase, partial [Frankiaceae bacterium]|nr:pyridoxal-dependent decarboxylase [Frankiaceae bacterium]